jgi:hypothetical protein
MTANGRKGNGANIEFASVNMNRNLNYIHCALRSVIVWRERRRLQPLLLPQAGFVSEAHRGTQSVTAAKTAFAAFLFVLAFAFLSADEAWANVNVTPASGGGSISADSAAPRLAGTGLELPGKARRAHPILSRPLFAGSIHLVEYE